MGEYVIAEPKLVEVQSAEPVERSDMLKYHGMKSLAESNFGVKPMARLNRDEHNGYDAQRVIYRDTVTGVEIWKVTHFPILDRLIGTGQKSWSADGKYFAFVSHFRPWTNMLGLVSGDATRIISDKNLGAPASWSPRGHTLNIIPFTGVYAYDPETREKRTVFEIPAGRRFPGRNWIRYSPESNRVLQFSRQFGERAVLRVWDVKTMEYEEFHARTTSAPEHKHKDWLYGGRFTDPDTVSYGMNHKPHLSEHNEPQAWRYNLKTKQYTRPPEVEDRGSHGSTSPGGKRVAYYRSGLGYRKSANAPLIHIGGLGGDGHMCFRYQDRIAVAGDVSGSAMVTMIYPDTRNVVLLTYAQNEFNGYYGSIIFVSMSPDATKMCFTSDMMGYRDLYWAVMNYPQPPTRVRAERTERGVQVAWAEPEWGDEIAGYAVYRSHKSGGPYSLATPRPVPGTTWLDAKPEKGGELYYAVRSLENSGLASKSYSNEAATSPAGPRRLYFEAEFFSEQRTPFRLMIDKDAVNEKFVRIAPKLEERKDATGVLAYDLAVPRGATYRLWARVRRGMGSGAECTLTAGAGRSAQVTEAKWTWQVVGTSLDLEPGRASLRVSGRGKGLSVDRFLLTDDLAFTPEGKGGDIDTTAPDAPASLAAKETRHFEARLTWEPTTDPEFGHYQLYRRRGAGVKPTQEFLVGSPGREEWLDYNLRARETYTYVVTVVDNWGNESRPSAVLTVRTPALPRRVITSLALADVTGVEKMAKHMSGERNKALYEFTASDDKPAKLRIPFEVDADGDYAVWVRGAAGKSYFTMFQYRVDNGVRRYCTWIGKEHKKGQKHSERIQWDRLMAMRQDAGTVVALKKGQHTLHIEGQRGRECSFILDKILVTNDLGHIPPGKRFMP